MKLNDLYHSRVVLDSSVLVKPFLEEMDCEKVERLFTMHKAKELTILISPLLFFEIGNIFAFKLNKEKAEEALEIIKKLQLAVMDLTLEEQKEALCIAQKYPKISFYDASYHILAKAFDATFITADKEYFKQAKREGGVELLEELNE